MAWTTILDSLIQVGKPIRAVDIRAIRDNIVAVCQGLSGAPKVEDGAFSDGSINANKLVAGSVTATQLATGANEGNWVGYRLAGQGNMGIGTIISVSCTVSGVTTGTLYPGSNFTIPNGIGVPPGTWKALENRVVGGIAYAMRVA